MKTLFYPPGFVFISHELECIIATNNQVYVQTHKAAKKLAQEILDLFPEGLCKNFLKLNAFENLVEVENQKLFPKRTFLEVVLMTAINNSQERNNFSTGFVFIDSTEFQNIGFSTASESRAKTEATFEEIFREIIKITNLFIIPGFMQWKTQENSDFAEFYVNCEFMKPLLLLQK